MNGADAFAVKALPLLSEQLHRRVSLIRGPGTELGLYPCHSDGQHSPQVSGSATTIRPLAQ